MLGCRANKRRNYSAAAAYRRTKARFEHRLARLERKAGQTLLDTHDAKPGTGSFWVDDSGAESEGWTLQDG